MELRKAKIRKPKSDKFPNFKRISEEKKGKYKKSSIDYKKNNKKQKSIPKKRFSKPPKIPHNSAFYVILREKLFEILGKKCTSCGFKDERALGVEQIDDEIFDRIQRGGIASSWKKYISEPELARKKLRVRCLNCNEIKQQSLMNQPKRIQYGKKPQK